MLDLYLDATSAHGGRWTAGSLKTALRVYATATVPYTTARHCEEAASVPTLGVRPGPKGGLNYADEGPGDRDVRGELWGHCSQNRDGNAVYGKFRWSDAHPARQRECMELLLCHGGA